MIKSGCKVFVVYNKKILIVLRDNKSSIPFPNMWDLPGGGQELGETLEGTAIREVKEEFGITLSTIKLVSIEHFGNLVAGRFISWITLDQYTHLKLGDEGQKFKFIKLDKVKDTNFVPPLKDYIQQNFDVLNQLVLKPGLLL